MKRYLGYMDHITVPDTLHEKLSGLKPPAKRPVWKKYGAAAAALVLAVGVGAFGLTRLAGPSAPTAGEQIPEVGEPDIALEESAAPGAQTPTLGGYEVQEGEVVSYYMLPYLEYGTVEIVSDYAIALPEGVEPRELSREELLAVLGGEESLAAHLDWGGYELTGTAYAWPDGTVWMLYVYGYAGPLDHFELSIMEGELPPIDLLYEESVVNHFGEIEVWADKYEGENSVSLRASFLSDGFGYCFDLTGTDEDRAYMQMSRFVRYAGTDGIHAGALTGESPAQSDAPAPEGTPAEEGNSAGYDPRG